MPNRNTKLLSGIIKKGKSNYTEPELVLPALELLNAHQKPLKTKDFIDSLENMFSPTGHDAKLLRGRHDTYFSQKVRNLKSHNTLTKLHFAIYRSNPQTWEITDKGRKFVETNHGILGSLKNQGFRVKDVTKKSKWNFADIIIEEGSTSIKETKNRKRSSILKKYAIKDFKKRHRGKVFCTVCLFNYGTHYGVLGRDYIEIHHLIPIHASDRRGQKTFLNIAAKKVCLLCANCHRMVHHRKGKLISISSLKSIIKKHKCIN